MQGTPWKLARSPLSPPVMSPVGSGIGAQSGGGGGGSGLAIPTELRSLLFHDDGTATKYPAYYTEEEWAGHGHLLKDYSLGVGDLREKRLGYCYELDGVNDEVVIGNLGSSLYSLKIRFYTPVAINSASANRGLFAYDYAGNAVNALVLGGWTNQLVDEVITLANVSNTARTAVTGITIPIGWHEIEILWNGSENRYDITLDGVAQTISVGASGVHVPQVTLSDVRLGRGHTSFGNFKISDVIIKSDADTVVAHYPLQEESGITAYDISGNGNHGTILNAVTSGVGSIHQPDSGVVTSYPNDVGYSIGTNLRSNSDALDQWSVLAVTVAADAANDGYGKPKMDAITVTATTSRHYISNSIAATAGVTYTVSCFAKQGGGATLILGDAGDANWNVAEFNLETGDLISANSTITGYGSEAIAGDIRRYWVTFTRVNTSNLTMVIGVGKVGVPTVSTSSLGTWAGGSEFLYANGAQVVIGNDPLAYVPTAGSAIATPVVVPAMNSEQGADLTSLEYSGRAPNYGLAKGPAWQGDGSTVYVDLGTPVIPASSDFTITIPYKHVGTGIRTVFSQTETAVTDGRIVVYANQPIANRLRLAYIDIGKSTLIDLPVCLTADETHQITATRAGNTLTITCEGSLGTFTASATPASLSIAQFNTHLLSYAGSSRAAGAAGPFAITTGGITVTYSPVEGTRDVAVSKSDGTYSVITDAVKNGALATLYTDGDGSWRLPAIENGANFDGTGLYPAAPGASVEVNGSALNIPANKHPIRVLVDRTGGVAAPFDNVSGASNYTDEEFNTIPMENTLNKRGLSIYAADRYGAALEDIQS